MKKHLSVSAAIIIKDQKILCVQRNKNKFEYISNKFEFPGGKIEIDESKENALIREIKEELNLNIMHLKKFLTVEHEYADFRLTMYSYLCKIESGELELKEHIASVWLSIGELDKLDWAAADLPIVEKLKKLGNKLC